MQQRHRLAHAARAMAAPEALRAFLATPIRLRHLPLLLAIGGLTLMGGIAMFQDFLLHHPARAAPAEMVSGYLQAWPAPEQFRGLVAEPDGAARGTVVVFHGNSGHAGNRSYFVHPLTRLGWRVILAEYPGYGPRPGSLEESSLVPDAAATIALAHGRYGGPLLVIGESLGAGVAAAAVGRERDRIAGLWLITPWDRLENLARHHYPWLPVGLLLRDRYDSVGNLAAFGRPVLVTLAEKDTLVPARFGQALYDGLPMPKHLMTVKGAGHSSWLDQADDAWWRTAVSLLLAPAGAQ